MINRAIMLIKFSWRRIKDYFFSLSTKRKGDELIMKPKKNRQQLGSDGWLPSDTDNYLKYKLEKDGDTDGVTDEMVLDAISNSKSLIDAMKYWEYNKAKFDEESACGKMIIAKLNELAQKRASQCETFTEAYDVLFYDLIYNDHKYDFYCIFTKRIYELAEKQITKAEHEFDFISLSKMFLEARRVESNYSNFDSNFRGAIFRVVKSLLTTRDNLFEFYCEAKDNKCELAEQMICKEIVERRVEVLKKVKKRPQFGIDNIKYTIMKVDENEKWIVFLESLPLETILEISEEIYEIPRQELVSLLEVSALRRDGVALVRLKYIPK